MARREPNVLYEVVDGGSRKFYRVELDGTRLRLHWGRLGAAGQRKILDHASVKEAERAFDDECARRRSRGYYRVHDEAAPQDAGAVRESAAREKLSASTKLTEAPRFMFVSRAKAAFAWLERRGGELWSASGALGEEARAAPSSKAFANDAAAERACNRRVAELLGDGYVLAAFDAAAPKKVKKTKPAVAKAPEVVEAPATLAFRNERWAFFGDFAIWPSYHGGTPSDVAARRGALVVDDVSRAQVVVIGDLRGAGRAEAKKKAERRGATLRVLDEAAYRELVRVDLGGKRFLFAGGFDFSPTGLEDGLLASMVERAGGLVATAVDDTLDYLVLGNRRGPSKIALKNQAERLIEAGAKLAILDENGFMELVRVDAPVGGAQDFAGFMSQLYGNVEDKKLGRAMDMLRKERLALYSTLGDDRLVGIVSSHSTPGSVYASWLNSAGHYGCAQSSLDACMGLQGSVCKHLLVLVIGLVRARQMPIDLALAWMRGAGARGPKVDTTLCAETFIQYKGATAGEIDWRPTETIPEDFYAV